MQDQETDSSPVSSRPVGATGARVEISERPGPAINGYVGLLLYLLMAVVVAWLLKSWVGPAPVDPVEVTTTSKVMKWAAIGVPAATFLGLATNLTVLEPGEAVALTFFGRYVGTVRTPGLHMVLPFTAGYSMDLRVSNFETEQIKVNDKEGNPIQIGAVVVCQIADTAKALFAVGDYDQFVRTQAESALRHIAMKYPYDGDEQTLNLRGDVDTVAKELAAEVAARVSLAGVEVIEARITNLSYAPEIAQAMLQRQQAKALLDARSLIVQGAVGMAGDAIKELETSQGFELDPERKAAMASNLLVVLCSDHSAAPVVNTSSIY